jgi:putative nucleotidyltransferase with HDIG domain
MGNNFRKIPTMELEEGMTIAEKVIDSHGAVLVSTGTILYDGLIDRLNRLGIDKVAIFRDNKKITISSAGDKINNEVEYVEQKKKMKNIFSVIQKRNHIKSEQIKEIVENAMKLDSNQDIMNLLTHIHEKDEYTYNHSVNVGLMAMLFGRWLDLDPDEVKKLAYAGFLHDVGKAKVSDEILNKDSSLTNEEYKQMKKHSIYGYKLVRESMYISDNVAQAVLLHHERKDGTGYPLGIEGNKIPFFARIIGIVDTFDAMTSDRVYRKHQVPFEVIKKLSRDSLHVFDIVLLNIFTKNITNYYQGEKVRLNNGEIGELVYIKADMPTEPVVKIGDKFIDLRKSELYIEDIYQG